MPQTTTDAKMKAALYDKVLAAIRNMEDGVYGNGLTYSVADVFDIPAAALNEADDIHRMWLAPPGAYLWDLRGNPSDMDTDATPALVYDLVFVDEDGTVKVTVKSGSTAGQAGTATDRIADAAVGKFIGGYYLAIKVTTPADVAAAGTYKAAMQFSVGILNYGDGQPRLVDVAV